MTDHEFPQAAGPAEPGSTPEATDQSEPREEAAHDTKASDANGTPSHASEEPQAPPAPAAEVPAAPMPQPAPEKTDDAAEFEAALEAFSGSATGTVYDGQKPLHAGEMLTATVIQVDRDKAFVDLGAKAEGVIPLHELSSVPIESADQVVKVGDQINVVVVKPESKEGNPIVSKRQADFEEAWDRIIADFEAGRYVTALVTDRVKGGLEVDLGVRGFVPASHVSSGHVRNLERYVGQSLKLKIIDVDRDRKKVVLSNRQAEEEERQHRKQELFTKVRPGEILEGTVRRLVDYGAFIDLGGVDGLLHISEIGWSRVDHPREVLKVGDEVRVMVLRLDPEKGRISLGRRQVLPDPWADIRERYSVGQRLTLPVSRVVQSGAFVKLPEEAEAFIPASEMSSRRGVKPSDVVQPGQEVEVQIIDLRPDERRMVLSIRALLPYEERAPRHHDDSRRPQRGGGQRGRGGRQDPTDTGGATIGERLGALRGLATAGSGEEAEEEEQQAAAPEPAAEASAEPVAEATSGESAENAGGADSAESADTAEAKTEDA
ncbi:30S ribosomal protein S1 [Fimbriimonadia bacterium ATM]|nr:MAG: 30S ribosomal protein S1 [Armatimonadota bacterium]MBC6969142.1 30S ribosomal protein S1 [Armatimonadota bacterium]MCE7900415.1 30S ribosomal protein S1 [Armatimonadetes bacterium ATM1]MDL1928306.1 30S ribosomal protein S1 [Fimbriimonadia bacterium ATM]RIJ97627.1 MAG: 30S ribosomal protein S1 [Armatimonadota bacterium]